MKDICEGRKTRREVIQETLDQYRNVYNRTQQRLPLLQAVSLPFHRYKFAADAFAGCVEVPSSVDGRDAIP